MKKQTTLFYFVLMSFCLLQFYSCIKPPNNNFDPRDGNNVYDGCRIQQIVSQFYNNDKVPVSTRQFVYNNKGNPVSVIADITSTGSANLGFKYDNKGRLVEYNAGYPNGLYDFIHRYGYSQNRITTDTVINSYVNPTFISVAYLSYDNLNRVVKDAVAVIKPSPFSYIRNYDYDPDGNLVSYGVYDDKLNPHRTNKVWMLIDRNYSVNNLAGASTYNSVGLPLFYPGSDVYYAPSPFQLGYYGYGSGKITITYDCK